ncbi:hypothetical protein ACFWP5_08825 [Streptomyces sp. NPDC058469]|uniref:hypothetical protein n=1 Tax=Streptomyces sp. NPDC058469 TaxID=3346514 RepID=UPI0036487708
MTTFVNGNHRSAPAGADLSAKQYYIVKQSSGNTVLASAATDKITGVLMNSPVSGELAQTWLRSAAGTLKVVLGGTVTEGAAVTSDGSGKGIATTTPGDQILGYKMGSGSNIAGDIVELMPSTAKY